MTETEKLIKLRKLYRIILRLLVKYAQPIYGYYNGGEWYKNTEEIIVEIENTLKNKLDTTQTLKRIADLDSALFMDYVGINLKIKDKNIKKREKMKVLYIKVQDLIYDILSDYNLRINKKY